MKHYIAYSLALVITVFSLLTGCTGTEKAPTSTVTSAASSETVVSSAEAHTEENSKSSTETASRQESKDNTELTLANLPAYSGKPYVPLCNNVPKFTKSELANRKSYEKYAPLDKLGRCGMTIACIGRDIMPTEKRDSIGQVKPTGWHTVKYDGVDGKYLYNRCHLIGFQLTGENANERNLITGTRYLNVEGMLPFENMVADYVKETGNHVLYRVVPVFEGNNLLAKGVTIEAESVEDHGKGILFHVFAYNVQPGIQINYANGKSSRGNAKEVISKDTSSNTPTQTATYILNNGTRKFHNTTCSDIQKIKQENRETFSGNRQDLLNRGYSPCGHCHP